MMDLHSLHWRVYSPCAGCADWAGCAAVAVVAAEAEDAVMGGAAADAAAYRARDAPSKKGRFSSTEGAQAVVDSRGGDEREGRGNDDSGDGYPIVLDSSAGVGVRQQWSVPSQLVGSGSGAVYGVGVDPAEGGCGGGGTAPVARSAGAEEDRSSAAETEGAEHR